MFITPIKECLYRIYSVLSPSFQMQTELEKRISKVANLLLDIPFPLANQNYIERCATQKTLLGLRVISLEQKVGFFDRIFNGGKIHSLIQKAQTLQWVLDLMKEEASKLCEAQRKILNKETKQFFRDISLDLFTYELPKAEVVKENPRIDKPVVSPEAAALDKQTIPGILTHPYKLAYAFMNMPDAVMYLKRTHFLIEGYKNNGKHFEINQDEFDCLFESWNSFYNQGLEGLCNTIQDHSLTEFIQAEGTQYYIKYAMDALNMFLVNYRVSPIFSTAGRKQLLEANPQKIIDYIFDVRLSKEGLNPSEKFLVHLGKGICTLAEDLIQKCKVDPYWKDWCTAYSRTPWNYPITQNLFDQFSEDTSFTKGLIKNFFLKAHSYENYVSDLYKKKAAFTKKTPKHLKGKAVEKASKKLQKLEGKCRNWDTPEGQRLYNVAAYYYNNYVTKLLSRFIDYHDPSIFIKLTTKIVNALDTLTKQFDTQDSTELTAQLQVQLKEILLTTIEALQIFLRESEKIPYEKLLLDCLNDAFLSFTFEANQTNYLVQYWEKLALPFFKLVTDSVENYPWETTVYPAYIPYGSFFLERQSLPGYMRNKATLLHHLNQNLNLEPSLTKISQFLHRFLGTSSNTFSVLFSDVRNSWNSYTKVVYENVETLPHFTKEFFSLNERWKKKSENNNSIIDSYYFLEVFYRAYKSIPFLNANYQEGFLKIDVKEFVQNLFKNSPKSQTPLEENLSIPLKDLIFWIKFRATENRKEAGWIEYELNTAETLFESLLTQLGLSKLALSALLTLGKNNFFARLALKKRISYLFDTTKTRREAYVKKPKNPEKKFDSVAGQAFNNLLDKVSETIYIPFLQKLVDNHDISQLITCLSAWKEAFEGYKTFIKTGNEKDFDQIIAKTLHSTLITLQKICQDVHKHEGESLLLRYLDETLQEYPPNDGANFSAHQFEHVVSKLLQRVVS